LLGQFSTIGAHLGSLFEQRDIRNRASAARLAEYVKLKDEIANRSTLQSAIITINIAAVGTLGGIVLGSHPGSNLVLLLLTPLSTALGLWWLDHAQTINRIGSYIRDDLWPSLIEWQLKPDEKGSYEEVVPTTSALDRSTLIVPFAVMFIFPSSASIVALVAFHAIKGLLVWLAWGAGLSANLFLVYVWIRYLIGVRKASKRSRTNAASVQAASAAQ
jgi:hypothetical protein